MRASKIYRIYTEQENKREIIRLAAGQFESFTIHPTMGYYRARPEKVNRAGDSWRERARSSSTRSVHQENERPEINPHNENTSSGANYKDINDWLSKEQNGGEPV